MRVSLDFFFHAVHEQIKSVPNHAHKCYEIVYYLRGKGRTLIGRQDYDYQSGQFAIVLPHTVHNERHYDVTEVMFVGFSCSSAIPELVQGVYADSPGQPVLAFMRRMAGEMRQQQPYYMSMLNALLNEQIVHLARSVLPGNFVEPEYKVQYAKAFIDEHYTQKVDFAALSAQSGYSYDRFRHLFKEHTGCSPTQYIMRKRIELAKTLLTESSQLNSSIALECGFFNDAQFCSLFKRETGLTPGEYRRKMAESR